MRILLKRATDAPKQPLKMLQTSRPNCPRRTVLVRVLIDSPTRVRLGTGLRFSRGSEQLQTTLSRSRSRSTTIRIKVPLLTRKDILLVYSRQESSAYISQLGVFPYHNQSNCWILNPHPIQDIPDTLNIAGDKPGRSLNRRAAPVDSPSRSLLARTDYWIVES